MNYQWSQTAALAIIGRLGVGKIRHMDTSYLWVQEKSSSGAIAYKKVDDNNKELEQNITDFQVNNIMQLRAFEINRRSVRCHGDCLRDLHRGLYRCKTDLGGS